MKGHAARIPTPFTPPPGPPPGAGAVRLRVRYCECDPMNVAHHAAYVPWLEIGRTELLRDAGVSYAQLEQAGVYLVIVKLDLRYRRPVFYDDLVEVRTRVSAAGKVKIEHAYEVAVVERLGKAHGEIAATGASTLACVDREGRVATMPAWLVGA